MTAWDWLVFVAAVVLGTWVGWWAVLIVVVVGLVVRVGHGIYVHRHTARAIAILRALAEDPS